MLINLLKNYIRNDTRRTYASYIDTRYYFSHDGEYGKTIYINPPVQIPGREKLSESNDMVIYTSEMTEHDFEIAGQALVMIKKRLEPLIPP